MITGGQILRKARELVRVEGESTEIAIACEQAAALANIAEKLDSYADYAKLKREAMVESLRR